MPVEGGGRDWGCILRDVATMSIYPLHSVRIIFVSWKSWRNCVERPSKGLSVDGPVKAVEGLLKCLGRLLEAPLMAFQKEIL